MGLLEIAALSIVFLRVLGVIAVILVIIFVHEMGHYLVARLCGIRATVFSLGFGPEILGFFDKKGTRWRLSLIPLGGYVKFVGDDDAMSVPSGELNQTPLAGAFFAASAWRRAATVFAGPFFNGLFTVVILAFFLFFYQQAVVEPIVGGVQANMPAAQAGLQKGDRILTIDGQKIESFDDLMGIVSLHGDDTLQFTIERAGQVFERAITPARILRSDGFGHTVRMGAIGVYTPLDPNNTERIDPKYVKKISYSFIGAIGESLKQSQFIVTQTIRVLGRLVVGRVDRCQLSGPTKTASIAWQVSELGFLSLLRLAAVLSIGIGLINLIPIPPLDGGHFLIYILEGMLGRPLPNILQQVVFKVGMVLILVFMVFAVSNDFFPC